MAETESKIKNNSSSSDKKSLIKIVAWIFGSIMTCAIIYKIGSSRLESMALDGCLDSKSQNCGCMASAYADQVGFFGHLFPNLAAPNAATIELYANRAHAMCRR